MFRNSKLSRHNFHDEMHKILRFCWNKEMYSTGVCPQSGLKKIQMWKEGVESERGLRLNFWENFYSLFNSVISMYKQNNQTNKKLVSNIKKCLFFFLSFSSVFVLFHYIISIFWNFKLGRGLNPSQPPLDPPMVCLSLME